MSAEGKTPLTIPLVVALAVFAAIGGAFVASGALGGTPIKDAADGWLGADSTLLAPGTGAFAIWSVIYLGLAVYAVWQLGATARMSPTQRALRPLAAASALLNALWLAAAQLGWLGATVLVMAALLAVLIWIFMFLVREPLENPTERWIMWLVFGPYLGWVSVATVANIAAWLASLGVGRDSGWVQPLAVVLVVVAALIGAATVLYSNGRVSAALAMAWGVAWIGVGRSDGGTTSSVVAVGAFACAGALLLFTVIAGAVLTSRRKRLQGARP
ncbi:tryptophan-rich sensory protein [Paeniglutamicibacter sp. R2-26]|uniref:tryptophan-rich sensory protein n=1 Tax=Paeniglutamicibacter sp. R2-26 TaxID=3144417 RepID=UPI003EE5E065